MDIDGDSLFADGVVIVPVFFDVVIEEGVGIPGGFFFGDVEFFAFVTGEINDDIAVLGGDAGQLIFAGDVTRIGGFYAGLHGGNVDGDAWHIDTDEVTEDADTSGGGGEGHDEFSDRGVLTLALEGLGEWGFGGGGVGGVVVLLGG